MSLSAAVVRPISLTQARAIIEQHESMCGVGGFAFALFLDERLASVVVFGHHPASNLAPHVAGSIALLRGFTLPDAPKNCASKLIRRAMRLLPEHYASVIAFSDAVVGENGAIYRAAGFTSIGASQGGRRLLVHHEGKIISERAARRRFGTASATKLAALGLKVELAPRRKRYVVRLGRQS